MTRQINELRYVTPGKESHIKGKALKGEFLWVTGRNKFNENILKRSWER